MVKKLVGCLLLVLSIGVISGTRWVVAASDPQFCKINNSCIVGEFLFDDNYAPINVGATCTLTSRDPSGNLFVNNAAMTASGKGDGWNSYTVSVGATDGIYPTQMCCTVPADIGTTQYMCLDKSFRAGQDPLSANQTANAVWDESAIGHTNVGSFGNNLQNPTLTASDIWTYANRTLSAGSSLAAEIWNYTETSTNNFAGLIAKIWGNSTVATLSTKSDILGIGTSLGIISDKIDNLDTKVSSIGSTLGVILNKWGSYSVSDILGSVNSATSGLGSSGDSCSVNSIFGNIACVRDKWGAQTAQSLYDVANNAVSVGTSLRAELSYNGKSTTAYQDMQSILGYVNTLQGSIGLAGDAANQATLFGKLNGNQSSILGVQTSLATVSGKIDNLSSQLVSIGSTVGLISSKWGSYSVSDILSNISGVTLGLGNSGDSCGANSIFGSIACVRDKWGSQTADSLLAVANNTLSVGNSLRAELNFNGKSTTAYDEIITIKNNIGTLQTNLTNSTIAIQDNVSAVGAKVDTLTTTVGGIGTNVSNILGKWGIYSVADILGKVTGVGSSLGTAADGCGVNSVFGNIDCVKQKWGSQTAQALYDIANSTLGVGNSVKAELTYNGKTTKAYQDLQTIANYVDTLEMSIGNSGDLASAGTVLGKLNGNSGDIAGVKSVVDSINTKVDALATNLGTANTNITTLINKWNGLTVNDVIAKINGIGTSLGTGSDSCTTNSIFGNIACVRDKWGVQTADTLYTAANNAYSTISSLRTELDYGGKSTTAYADLQTVKSYLSGLQTSVGTASDLSSAGTLFGKIKGNKDAIAGVQTTVDSIESRVISLSTTINTVNSGVTTLTNKWGSYSVNDVLTNINNIKVSIGVSGDICGSTTTIFGGINCLQNNGGGGGDNTAVLAAISNSATKLDSLITELDYNGKSTTAYTDLLSLRTDMAKLVAAMGSSDDLASVATVFGRMRKIQDKIDTFDSVGGQTTTTIDKWGTLSASDIYDKVKDLAGQISTINTVNNVSTILNIGNSATMTLQDLKNELLAIKALSVANKSILEKTSEKPVITSWLEEGSIIFKSMLTNPGGMKQMVPFKFYLPKEADKKNVLKIDPELTLTYDPEQGAYYASGNFVLNGHETKIVAIEVEDVWKISDSQINSLKLQADQLSKPLNGTSYFAQGSTLKSDILAQLEIISRTQKEAITPDSRIKVYRDNSEELSRVLAEVNDLKILATSVASGNSLIGFVGGSQVVSSWLVIFILVTGTVFLAIYIKIVIRQAMLKSIPKKTLLALMLVTMVPSFAGTWMMMNKIVGTSSANVLGARVEKIELKVANSSEGIKVRQNPSDDSAIITTITRSTSVDKLQENNQWVSIGISTKMDNQVKYIQGWIKKVFE